MAEYKHSFNFENVATFKKMAKFNKDWDKENA